MTLVLTPLLSVGSWAPHEAVETRDPDVAVDFMRQGYAVLVPKITTARDAMVLLGMTDDEIDRRIIFGLTGELV